MCGRYAYVLPPEAMLALFRMLNELVYPPRYNIKPTEPIATVRERHGERTGHMVRWGFVPPWVADPKAQKLLINARSEGLVDSPTFRNAARHQRCIVPASGYYEWMTAPDGTRQPYYLALADGETMAFAGVYSTWRGPDGTAVETAAIVTVPAAEDLAAIHDRMPAVLQGDSIDAWLDTDHVGPEVAVGLTQPTPPGTVRFHPVGREVGKATAEGPDLIRPLTPEQQAAEAQPQPRKRKAASGQLDLF